MFMLLNPRKILSYLTGESWLMVTVFPGVTLVVALCSMCGTNIADMRKNSLDSEVKAIGAAFQKAQDTYHLQSNRYESKIEDHPFVPHFRKGMTFHLSPQTIGDLPDDFKEKIEMFGYPFLGEHSYRVYIEFKTPDNRFHQLWSLSHDGSTRKISEIRLY